MRHRRLFAWVVAVTAGCGSGGPGAPDAAPPDAAAQSVTIPFAARFGSTPFACGAPMANIGDPPVTYTPTDLRFYVSDLSLIGDDGRAAPVMLDAGPFQGNGIALLDFENGCGSDGTPELHTSITGSVAAGSYHRIAFTLGVPSDQDHLNVTTASPPLDVTGMYWTWLSGYKFLKVDGAANIGGTPAPYFVHLGAGGCPGTNDGAPPGAPCASPNVAHYQLSGFTLGVSTIVADLGAVLATVDLSVNTPGTAPGCMSEQGDAECAQIMPRLGVGAAATQQLFTVTGTAAR
jgi:uncharacterized repeat protein (TIGR04052 family)